MKRWLVPLLLTFVLAGCAPFEPQATGSVSTQTQPPPTAAPTLQQVEPTPIPDQSSTSTPESMYPVEASQAVEAAKMFFAQPLGLDVEDIQVLQVRAVEWPDDCLGIPNYGELCAESITPGYVIVLRYNAGGGTSDSTLHTDADGSTLRILPLAVISARQDLSESTGIPIDEIQVLSFEHVNWRSSCLGVTSPGVNCLDVIVPGLRIIFQAAGERYEYHTDAIGNRVVQAPKSDGSRPQAVLIWNNLTEPCMMVEIGLQEVWSAPCGIELVRTGHTSANREAELQSFSAMYARQTREINSGNVTLHGTGQVIATPAEMRMLAEWSRLVFDETVSSRSGAAWSLAFSWHREGGIAGFCDDVGVYLTGDVIVNSCKSGDLPGLGRLRLDSQQLARLYNWVDSLASFEFEQTDPATADAMTIHLVFAGQGTGAVSANQQSGMLHLADELALQAQTPPDPQGQAAAELALNSYLLALSAGDFATAAALYGGSYDVLIDNNPSRDPANHASLFEGACTINGHVCNLSVRSIVHVAGLAPGIYRFTVELAYPDGALFELFGCCTDVPLDPPQTQFAFQVDLVDGRYLVMTLPIYAG